VVWRLVRTGFGQPLERLGVLAGSRISGHNELHEEWLKTDLQSLVSFWSAESRARNVQT
jgi:hypothetical protein